MGEASPAVEQWPVWTGPAEQLSGIDCLTQALSLSPFERDVLLLAAAPALDGRFPSLIAQANGSQALLSPTFSLALAALPDGHWSAITPDGALRKWRLIAPLTGPVHTLAPLVAEEQIWHFLLGIASTEPTVAALLVPPVQDRLLLPGQAAVAEQIVHLLSEGETHRVQLVGATTADRAQVVAAVARRLDARVAQVRVQALPTQDPELAEFQVRLRREFIFRTSFLHLELDDLDSQERPQRVAVERLIQDHQGVLLLTGPSRTDMGSLSSLIVPLPARQPHEQRAAWHRLLASERWRPAWRAPSTSTSPPCTSPWPRRRRQQIPSRGCGRPAGTRPGHACRPWLSACRVQRTGKISCCPPTAWRPFARLPCACGTECA